MNRTTRTLVASATGALALGVGLGVAGLASADPTTSPAPSASPSSTAGGVPAAPGARLGGPGHRGDHEAGLAKLLASALGVDRAQVQTALREYREANRPATPPAAGSARPVPRPARDDAALAKALADELDVPQAEVSAALTQIRTDRAEERATAVKDRLAEAVRAGTLTQAEADAVQKAADAGIVHVGPR